MPKFQTVNILGRLYSVEFSQMSSDMFGECCYKDHTIRINTEFSDEQQRNTLIHEVIHAILYESGLSFILDDGAEEGIVRAVEHGLTRSGLLTRIDL